MSLTLTPLQFCRIMQCLCIVGVVALQVLMLGPFQGAEQIFGLNDIMAHAIAFYVLSLGLFVCLPRWRRTDLSIVAMGIGVAVEILQGATGRSASMFDLLADGAGVLAATLPGMVERLRHHVRVNPYMSFADISRYDRRARRQTAEVPAMASLTRRSTGSAGRVHEPNGERHVAS